MPFLLAEILNFQGSTHQYGVGSFSKKVKAKFSYIPDEIFYFMQADTMEMKRFYQGIYPTFDEKLPTPYWCVDPRKFNISANKKGINLFRLV